MTILREEEFRALKGIELSGNVADLGGEKRSDYSRAFVGNYTKKTVNISSAADPDIVADLEKPLPLESSSFEAALLLNVLEHIYEYRGLLGECARILKKGGKVIVLVPWMFPLHLSPEDYHRYSASALKRALTDAGFTNVEVKAVGSGVYAAQYLMFERLMPEWLQRATAWFGHPLAREFDALIAAVARKLGKKYQASDYALGYLATGTRA